jgi:hypothetical protein
VLTIKPDSSECPLGSEVSRKEISSLLVTLVNHGWALSVSSGFQVENSRSLYYRLLIKIYRRSDENSNAFPKTLRQGLKICEKYRNGFVTLPGDGEPLKRNK